MFDLVLHISRVRMNRRRPALMGNVDKNYLRIQGSGSVKTDTVTHEETGMAEGNVRYPSLCFAVSAALCFGLDV